MHKFFLLKQNSLKEHNVATIKDLWAKAQADGHTGLALAVGVEIKKADVEEGETKKFHAIFSSATEDRHGEIVFQNFDLKAFKRNPVYLDSHNYWGIEHILGRVAPIAVKDGKLQGDIEFATFSPKGALAQELAEKGFLNTSSIGFIPKEFDDKGNILKSELLEISAVSIPANPEALYEFEKSIKSEDPAPEPTPEPTPDPTPEPTPEPMPVPTTRSIVADTVRSMTADRKRALEAVARTIVSLREPGAQKRQALKAVRDLLQQKADIAG